MSAHLDPSEVLKYLNQLGYCNITKEQLKDFIYDLKKLLKFDASKFEVNRPSETVDEEQLQTELCRPRPTIRSNQKSCPNKTVSGKVSESIPASQVFEFWEVPCNTRASSYKNLDRGSGISNSQTFKPLIGKENLESHKRPSGENLSTGLSSGTSNTSSASESDFSSSSRPSKLCSIDILSQNAQKIEVLHESGNGKHVKVTTKTRPTSFIRPWRLTSAPVKSVTDLRRSDPVTLYHYYQSIWEKQKLPGEDNHADLRWSIRERMLGHDPHPRPISRASSIEHLKRYRTKKS